MTTHFSPYTYIYYKIGTNSLIENGSTMRVRVGLLRGENTKIKYILHSN